MDIANLCSFSFDGLWFHFPTPFMKGDIVVDPEFPVSDGVNRGPFVVTDINTDPVKNRKAYHEILLQEYAKRMMPNEYTSEGMILAGLKEADNEREK